MSAGAFTRSRYESNRGDIYPIRVQPETLTLTIGGAANAAPVGVATMQVSAKAGGGKREIGMKARTVSFVFTGQPPEGYKADSTLTLPILTPTLWEAITAGDTGTYLGGTIEVVGTTAESFR